MRVHAATLASELRRRRVRPRSMVQALYSVDHSTWVVGDDLRSAPTSLLVLAALSMTTPGPGSAAEGRFRS